MNRRQVGYVFVSLVSFALGCTLGTTLPLPRLWAQAAQPAAGRWRCYEMNPGNVFVDPEITPSPEDSYASKFAVALDRVAAQAPTGTVYSPPMGKQWVCVKY